MTSEPHVSDIELLAFAAGTRDEKKQFEIADHVRGCARCRAFVVCRACSAARRCKSSTQPDGGEGLAMRKGYRREAGSEGSVEQMCELMDKNRI